MVKNIYFDSAASSLKSKSVIKKELDFLKNKYSNSGRGICKKAFDVDEMINKNRQAIANFINSYPNQIIFTSGATDSLNRIPKIIENTGLLKKNILVGVSDLDHHSARLPWEYLKQQKKCKIIKCPLDKNYNFDIKKIPKTDILIITAMSNVLGQKEDVIKIIEKAKILNKDVITIVDASQYIVYEKIDVKKWNCDFLCFSGHKIGTDTGLGILYIKEPLRWKPDKIGGGSINYIDSNGLFKLLEPPFCYESGTLPLTQIIGIIPAIDDIYKKKLYKKSILHFLYNELSKIDGIKLITKKESYLISFYTTKISVLDFGMLISQKGFCLRVGKMCASWIHNLLGIDSSIRISIGNWNTLSEAKYLIKSIKKILK